MPETIITNTDGNDPAAPITIITPSTTNGHLINQSVNIFHYIDFV